MWSNIVMGVSHILSIAAKTEEKKVKQNLQNLCYLRSSKHRQGHDFLSKLDELLMSLRMENNTAGASQSKIEKKRSNNSRREVNILAASCLVQLVGCPVVACD